MKYLSICSGIEAASVAFEPLGWRPLAFSEIEAFPRAVLKHHYPDTPCHGDFTTLKDETWIVDADMLCGAHPAKPSAWRATGNPWPTTGATSHCNSYSLPMQSTIFDQLLEESQLGSSGKTSPASSAPTTTPSVPSWADWSDVHPPSLSLKADGPARVWLMDQPDARPGGRWTPSTSAWPNDGSGSSCSLAAVLQDGPLPMRYFLSSKAAAGILRRAEARGKELPEPLRLALIAVAGATAPTMPQQDT